jgi:hypothetical protein
MERVLPTTAEIYKLAATASVSIDGLDASGKVIKRGSGLLIKDGLVATSLRVVEGASALRLRFSDGKEISTDQLLAWNRRQDWALIAATSQSSSTPKFAVPKSWNIGDRCFWLDVNPDGSRIIRDGQIVGLESPPFAGDRINLSGNYNRAALGGPLLDEQGQIIGVLGGTLPSTLLGDSYSDPASASPDLMAGSLGGIAIAANLLPASVSSSPQSLPALLASGDMMRTVSRPQIISFGMLTDASAVIDPKKHLAVQRIWKSTFQKGDASAAVILSFANNEPLKTTATIKLYDVDNHLVATGKTEKLNISRGDFPERSWTFPLTNLPSGFYRVDILVADGVAWRQFFKLVD